MCGRYLTPEQAALERHFGLQAPPDYFPSYNVAPSELAPVVRMRDRGLDLRMLVWGYRPGWAKRPWINARAETMSTARAFAPSARARRCLVPAAGWYEWQGDKAPKQPWVVHLDAFQPFAFAGLWTARETEAGWQRTFAILTTAAAGALADIHPRKPLVIDPADYAAWLSPETPAADVEAMVRGDRGGFSAYAVSSYVNKPEHDDARCLEPAQSA